MAMPGKVTFTLNTMTHFPVSLASVLRMTSVMGIVALPDTPHQKLLTSIVSPGMARFSQLGTVVVLCVPVHVLP